MDGILVVDKAQGMTSHDVVDFIRKRFGLKRCGHAGTLDPIATGVLVMLLGKYTKFFDSFMNEDKEYEAALILGATSDTGDAWGKVSEPVELPDFKSDTIEKVFKEFTGDIEQVPPMYSAIKFKGKKLYELARKGASVERKPRKISIKKLEISAIDIPRINFKVECSKGTYIRQLCADIGERLGCGAYMGGLRRTRSGRFGIGEAISIDELKKIGALDLEKRLYKG